MEATAPRRPASLDEVGALFSRYFTKESRAKGLAFKPRPDDIIISTYAKAGTTWMQQIVHQLRTGGDMAFSEITDVVPWIETAYDMGLDLDAEQRANPRAFKTHLSRHDVPKGCRYIVIVREPKDIAVSSFRFGEGWFYEPGSIPLDDYVRWEMLEEDARRSVWGHLLSWWPHRLEPDTLFLTFEDMRADPEGAVRRVADFMGIEPASPAVDVAIERSSLAYMQAHKHHFDDHTLRAARDAIAGLPTEAESNKVASGRVGDHREAMSPELAADFDARWQSEVAGPLGLADFDALRRQLASESKTPA
jgi:hypothetical protein